VAKDLLAGTKLVQSPGYSGRLENSGEALDAVWAPDGRSIVFAAASTNDAAAYAIVHPQLYDVPIAGGEPRRLTQAAVSYEHPRLSPDGRALYFTASDDDNQIYALDRLAMAPWPWTSGQPKLLSPHFDRSARSWAVSADGQSI